MDFTYQNRDLVGVDAPYNNTSLNERAVELAIALDWLEDFANTKTGKGLEVGNVLAHYPAFVGQVPGVADRRIVDFYEKSPGVENIDVFDIKGKFDWIVSISTLEHVGWDTEPRDPDAAQRAVEHLRSLLKAKGQMLVTVPAGYHPTFDAFLKTGAGATRDCTMVRDKVGGWKQSKARTFKPYGATTPWAESIWVGEYGG